MRLLNSMCTSLVIVASAATVVMASSTTHVNITNLFFQLTTIGPGRVIFAQNSHTHMLLVFVSPKYKHMQKIVGFYIILSNRGQNKTTQTIYSGHNLHYMYALF